MLLRLLPFLLILFVFGCPSEPSIPPGWLGPDGYGYDTSGNSPPELVRIGDKIVALGEPLTIVLEATDPDGDSLTYSSFGKLPEGSKFDKAEHRFDWTPSIPNQTVYLTFVVSDGQSFDRETIRIEVVNEKSNHDPEFQVVGDQPVVIGQAFELKLVATDADGDAIKFSSEGELPAQSFLDPATGIFVWTPTADLVGKNVRVTFVVSDGKLTDTMDVNFIVSASGTTSGPAPPTFDAIPTQVAEIGQTLSVALKAQDPNGDPISFSIYSGAPVSAAIEGDTFKYTPQDHEDGFTFVITLAVSDGVFTAYQTMDVSVQKSAGPVTCYDDPGEDNGSLFNATQIQAGTHQFSLCDTETIPQDKDYLAIHVPIGHTLNVSLAHDPEAGDLDLLLLDKNHITLASSMTGAAVEEASANSMQAQTLYILVLGIGQASYHVNYTLTVTISVTQECVDDMYEPNDTWLTADSLPPQGTPLQICAANKDWWSVSLMCGEDIKVTLDTGNQGDLDMHLFDSKGNDGNVLGSAATSAVVEVLDFKNAPEAGIYYLRVIGFPSAVTEAPYTLLTEYSGVCEDDAKGGQSQWSATPLPGGEGEFFGLRICCTTDWFQIDLAEGQKLILGANTPTADTSVGFKIYQGDFLNQVGGAAPSPGGDIVQFVPDSPGTYLIEVEGSVDAEYKIDWTISNQDGNGCSPLSCPKYQVCDPASGECVSDFCFTDQECPAGHLCKETYCVNPCTDSIDCRTEYHCKAFEDGSYCGVTGNSPYGQDCFNHASCITDAICIFKENQGYCAPVGCLENSYFCPTGTYCTYVQGLVSICGLKCYSDNECRVDDGYACSLLDFDPVGVCLP
jgi:hypothetical protein